MESLKDNIWLQVKIKWFTLIDKNMNKLWAAQIVPEKRNLEMFRRLLAKLGAKTLI